MKSMGDVVAEAPAKGAEIGLLRRVSIDSVDRPPPAVPYSGPGELRTRTLRSLKRGLGKLWRRHRGNASITEYDPSYKVAYLGNVLTGWAKGEGCVEKPVSTLWRNYVSSSRPDVSMRLTVTNGGLTATTKDHGLTEYWAHRVTYCTAPASHPRLFVWVYRHEGRRLRPELRCHAALCSKESTARRLATVLNARLQQALLEFRRDKVSKQNARLSLANAVYENPSLPRRKILLSTGGSNYRPPLERSKSAPKLSAIEEDAVAEEIEQQRFLDELRSLEHVARTWQEQEGWRLARLLDALHRESSDENGSISSGCETASTANSEERVSSSEDSHLPHEPDLLNGQRLNCSKSSVTTPMMTSTATTPKTPTLPKSPLCSVVGIQQLTGPRRNSEGSLNFMSCAISPRFRRRSSRQTRRRNRKLLLMSGGCGSGGSGGSSLSLSRSEGEESLEDEDEDDDEDEDGLMMLEDASGSPVVGATANYYDYEDVEDLQEIVDFRPHGETVRTSCGGIGGIVGVGGVSDSSGGGGGGGGGGSGGFSGGGGSGGCGGGGSAGQVANRLQTESYAALMARRDEVRKLISCRRACPGRDEIDACVKDEVSCRTFVSPKTLASTPVSSTTPVSTMSTAVVFHTLGSLDEEEADSDESGYVEASPKSSMDRAELKSRKEEQLDKEQQQQQQPTTTSVIATEANEDTPTKTSEHAEFIKCPISDTIKKLANASLRSSKAMRASTGARIEALGKSVATKPEIDGESPSLVQRKRLLAQQGVTV